MAEDDGGWGTPSSAADGPPEGGGDDALMGRGAGAPGAPDGRERNVFVDVGRVRFLFYRYFNAPEKWFRKYLYAVRARAHGGARARHAPRG